MSPFGRRARWLAGTAIASLPLAVAVSTVHAEPRLPTHDEVEAPVVDIVTAVEDVDGFAVAKRSATGVIVRLSSTVLFAKDSARICPQVRVRLKAIARAFHDLGPGRIKITGYTDDLGSARRGLDLSRRRAAAVAGQLAATLPSSEFHIATVGRGEAEPVVPNTSEENRAKNRRVIIAYNRL